jgi:hypothetical protein
MTMDEHKHPDHWRWMPTNVGPQQEWTMTMFAMGTLRDPRLVIAACDNIVIKSFSIGLRGQIREPVLANEFFWPGSTYHLHHTFSDIYPAMDLTLIVENIGTIPQMVAAALIGK